MQHTLRSAENVLKVLFALQKDGAVGLNQLSRSTEINKSTVYKILNTLKTRAIVEQDEDDKYKLGIGILQLSGTVLRELDLRKIARPLMKELSAYCGQTVTLGVRSGNFLSFIDRVDGQENVRFYCDVGKVTPLNGGAAAKALFAHLDADTRKDILNTIMEKTFTEHTKSAEELENEVLQIRSNGFSVSDEEVDPGVLAIGVPIFDHRNVVIAGMAVAGIKHSITQASFERNKEAIIKYGKLISEKMGATI